MKKLYAGKATVKELKKRIKVREKMRKDNPFLKDIKFINWLSHRSY